MIMHKNKELPCLVMGGKAPARLPQRPCCVCVTEAVCVDSAPAGHRLASSSPPHTPSWAPAFVLCSSTTHTQVRPDSRTEGTGKTL